MSRKHRKNKKKKHDGAGKENLNNIYNTLDSLYLIMNLESWTKDLDLLIYSNSYKIIHDADKFIRIYKEIKILNDKIISKLRILLDDILLNLHKYIDEISKLKFEDEYKNKFVEDFLFKINSIKSSLFLYKDELYKMPSLYRQKSFETEENEEDVNPDFFTYRHKKDPKQKKVVDKKIGTTFYIEDGK